MKLNNFKNSMGSQTKNPQDYELLMKSNLDANNTMTRNDIQKFKSVFGSNKKQKLKINKTHHHIDHNFGKFFKVRLKPLQHSKDRSKDNQDSLTDLQKFEHEKKSTLIGFKNVLNDEKNYFYEFQLGSKQNEKADNTRQSLALAKNKEILEGLYQPLKNMSTKNNDQTRNNGINQTTFRVSVSNCLINLPQ